MTSKLTRKQRINEVKELIANAEQWAGYYEHPIHDKPQREMFEGMARVMAEHLVALAAMDSEPVAWRYRTTDIKGNANPHWSFSEEASLLGLYQPLYANPPITQQEPVAYTDERNLGYIDRGRETAYLWGKQNSEAGDVPLYRHAQQPLVPDEMSFEAAISFVEEVGALNERDAAYHAWNACRAAMLQAKSLTSINPAPALISLPKNAKSLTGNSPVIPGWIPVSERMPDEGETVLGCSGLNGRHSGVYTMRASVIHRKNSAIDTYGIKHERVTHWMPLPAAPQEVK